MIRDEISNVENKIQEKNIEIRQNEQECEQLKKVKKEHEVSNKNQSGQLADRETKAEQLREQVENLQHEYAKKSKMLQINKKKESEIILEKANNEA